MSARLISLVGPPGSGKTTVAHWLAPRLGARLVLEDFAGNPFLAPGFLGHTELRLAAQLQYLLGRTQQLLDLSWPEAGTVVSDYTYLQDALYARVWLAGEELETYRRVNAQLAGCVHGPDVLVHLDGPVELLVERVARRGRPFEALFGTEFLGRLRREYQALVADAPCPVVAVDIARQDLRRPDEQAWLLEQLQTIAPSPA